MPNFVKYYSYNQLIEEHDVLVMSQQEFQETKDQLDNPQLVVLVKRKGGPREPKIPKWFQSYKQEADARFEKIEARLDKIESKLDDTKAPRWFTTWCKEKFEPLVKDVQNIKDVLARNNIH